MAIDFEVKLSLSESGYNINPEDAERILNKIREAARRVGIAVNYYASEAIPRMESIKYVERVRQAIVNQEFVSGYKSYNERYAKWKAEFGRNSDKFWVLYGDLLGSLTSFKIPEGYMGGVPSGVMDRGGKSWFGKGDVGEAKPIAMYGKVMEFGLPKGTRAGYHPARPMFEPTMVKYAYSEIRLKIADDALDRIGAHWVMK